MSYPLHFNDEWAVLGGIHGADQAAGTYNTAAISLADFDRIVFLVDSAAKGASGTLDFKVQGCATSGGTYADVTNAAITQMTVNNKYTLVEVRPAIVQNTNPTFQFVKGLMTIGTATNTGANVVALGSRKSQFPASELNATDVAASLYV